MPAGGSRTAAGGRLAAARGRRRAGGRRKEDEAEEGGRPSKAWWRRAAEEDAGEREEDDGEREVDEGGRLRREAVGCRVVELVCNRECPPAETANKKRKISHKMPKMPYLRSRMSPSGIYQFINNPTNKPSDNQILTIQQMGFEGLLHLQTDTVPGNLAYWLVSTFGPYKRCLLDGNLPILEEDIHACMGIPMGPLVVDEAPIGDKSPQFLSLLEDFKSQYEGDVIDVKVILRKLSTQIDGGDNFKRNFIVYIFSSFLGGVKGNKASLRILKSLSDTSLISEYNWCNFIKKKLAEQVLSWQKEEFSEEKTVKENWFGRPIMVLVFIYLYRRVFIVRTEEDKDDQDRNKVPSSSQVNNVFVDKLASKANNLAKAFVEYKSVTSEALNKLPSSEVVCKMVAAVDENVLRDVQKNENVDSVKGKDNVEDHVVHTDKKVENVLRDLQDNENVDDVKGKDNVESFWGLSWGWSEAQLLDALNVVGGAMQPSVAKRVKLSQTTKVAEKVDTTIRKRKKPRSPPDYPSFSLLSSSDDDSYEPLSLSLDPYPDAQPDSQPTDNTYHIPPQQEDLPPQQHHLSSVVVNKTSSLDRDAKPDSQRTHNTDHMPPEQEHVPSQHLHLSHVVANTTSHVILLTPSPLLANTNISPSPVIHHPNVILIPDTPLSHKPSSSRQAVYIRRRSPRLAKLDEVTDVPCSTPTTVHVPFPLCPVEVHDDTDFDIPNNDNEIPDNVRGKRVAFAAEVFRSPYLQRNICLLVDLNQAEKKILDFILGDSYDESEILFRSQSSTLTRSELKTVVEGDRVSSHAIHVWCEILNNNERLRSRDSPCRLFLSFPKHINLENVDVVGASLKDLLISLLEQKLLVVTSVSWMMPEVIDMFGIKSTVGRTDLLYLPTTAYTVVLEKNPSIWGNYVKCTYILVDGSSIEKLYNIAGVLSSTPSYEHLKYIHMMDFNNVCVTQQKTIYDCGVFVLKFLSAVDNEILWKDTKYFENLPQYRKSSMLDLLKWEKNSMKVFF
ncbi:hypothetical protein KSS87_021137 [Heliosperma pusillum]|nr:hypothetical protein KSS87_021137 [Heliosperma pusillum]